MFSIYDELLYPVKAGAKVVKLFREIMGASDNTRYEHTSMDK